jgi:hypothetical protein
LAGKPCGDDVDLGELIEFGEVAEVRGVGHGLVKPVACAGVDVGYEHGLGFDACVLQAEF